MGPKPLTLDDYIVTKNGDVINKHTKRVLKQRPNSKGYLRVAVNKKFYFVHRLVAQEYIENPDHKSQVNHIDGNKRNNHVDNLEWVNNQENRDHAVSHGLHLQGEKCSWSKLTEEDVLYIREHSDMNRSELAKMFGVARTTIDGVLLYRTWK